MGTASNSRIYDLEERLVKFAVAVIRLAESVQATRAGIYLSGQLIRSGTSPALNYGEAQSAESRSDFVHKLKIILKELRETRVSLKILERIFSANPRRDIRFILAECDQLISIFVTSIRTAQTNLTRKKEIAR